MVGNDLSKIRSSTIFSNLFLVETQPVAHRFSTEWQFCKVNIYDGPCYRKPGRYAFL